MTGSFARERNMAMSGTLPGTLPVTRGSSSSEESPGLTSFPSRSIHLCGHDAPLWLTKETVTGKSEHMVPSENQASVPTHTHPQTGAARYSRSEKAEKQTQASLREDREKTAGTLVPPPVISKQSDLLGTVSTGSVM